MCGKVTLEEVERLASSLPSSERLKLVARICEHLSATATVGGTAAVTEHLAHVDAWLMECDAVAANIEGEFDSAADVRQVREERANY